MAAHYCEFCAANRQFEAEMRARHYPKPATPEPPEWIDDGPRAMTVEQWRHLSEMAAKRGREIAERLWGVEAMERALKTLRDSGSPIGTPEDVNAEKQGNATLARAMSTPLPHDPDIHTRLMPWRNK